MTFLAPGLLAGGLAVAVPVAIHLLSRRRYRTIPWAAMEFLLAAEAEAKRRMRIESWLLLSLRCLGVLLLAAALARPALPAAAFGPSEVVILLDASVSMAARDGSRVPFSWAKAEAASLLAGLPASARVSAFLATDAAEPLAIRSSPVLALREIEAAGVTDRGSDLVAALRGARKARGSADPALWIVLTDARRGSLGPSGPAGLAEAVSGIRRERGRLVWVDASLSEPWNATVEEVSAPTVVRASEPFAVRAAVRALPEGAAALPVHLLVDGERRAVASARPSPSGTAECSFPAALVGAGWHVISAEVDADALLKDNRRDRVVYVRERVSALAVDGDPRPGPFASAASFLAAALAPREGAAAVRLRTLPVEGFRGSPPPPGAEDVWILANVGALLPSDARLLEAHLARGRGLLVFLGDRTEPASWTGEGWRDGKGFLPGPVSAWRPLPGDGRAVEISPDAPFLRDLRGRADLSPAAVRLRGAAGIGAEGGRGRAVLVGEGSGAPVAIASEPSDGRVVVVACGADLRSSNLPLVPFFVVMLHRSLDWLAGDPAAARNRGVGERILVPAPPEAWAAKPVLRPPAGTSAPSVAASLREEAGRHLLDFGPALRSGIHGVEARGEERSPVAVSIDPAEGDLRRLAPESFAGLPRDAFERSRSLPAHPPRGGREERREVAGTAFWGLAGVLALESVLAALFSRRRAGA